MDKPALHSVTVLAHRGCIVDRSIQTYEVDGFLVDVIRKQANCREHGLNCEHAQSVRELRAARRDVAVR